ncbi:uncharacterized protein LOC141617297 [Silene latifolia]|uniref:uncharacterized protein LOC141617297 n=1 Tax=Silene latifolia TaxID=37657 RepID=UPI003D783313
MKKPNLSDYERHRIVCLLFESCKNGKPQHGEGARGGCQVQCKKGKERTPCPINVIMTLDVSKRTTLKRLGKAIGHSPSTCHRWVKEGIIKTHTNAIKPALTQDNKHLRLHFVMGKLVFDRLLRCIKFFDMGTIVHIDEKLFYMTKPTSRYYIGSTEPAPYRCCKSKRYITKVMFMCAVSRPTYKENGEVEFDGKLGIWPFTFQEPAKRNSKNRVAEAAASKEISIQQDNAKPHINGNDKDFLEAAASDGFNIKLTQQPANSPDLNILDLGFFRSIQSLQDEHPARSVEELVKSVQDAYEDETVEVLDNVWLSLQACMIDIMKLKGHNNYPLPHLAKATQRRAETLPRNLEVDEELVKECIQFLITCGLIKDEEQLMLGIQVPF